MILLSIILSCNRVCLSDVELTMIFKQTGASIYWFAKKSSLPWGKIFVFSVQMMFKSYGITEGVIAIDQTDKSRFQNTPFIDYTHKYLGKKLAAIKMAKR